MASVTTPTINKIIRLNNYDLLGTKCKKYNMYMCLDTLQLWYDESDSKRTLYGYVGVDTVNDLQNNIIPELGTTYYCWESNSLWLWMNRWICLYTDGKYPSAYRTDNGYIEEVYLDDQQPTIVDNNGLLRDGSVAIRDANRIIKGRLYVSDNHDNLVISSFLGGGIRILPNGAFSTDGELYIDDQAKGHIRGEWNVLNHEIYVDYTEDPSKDNSVYRDSTHRYKVWHEGNLKLNELELTGENIYNKIIDAQKDGTLPDPLVLNVDRLNGLKSTDFALKSHIHKAADISDFKSAVQTNVNLALDTLFKNNMLFKGARITWVEASQKYMLSTDSFVLSATGGVTGQATVMNNTNTSISLTVDPTKHVHSDIVKRLETLEEGASTELENYYTKPETNELLASMFSETPEPGKALLVDANGKLPVTASMASDLDHDTILSLEGDIEGSVTFGYDKAQLNLSTDASNIISDTPTAGKALKLDADGNLPTKSYSSMELDHDIAVKLIGDVTGTATLDTSTNSLQINTTISDSAENAVPWSAVGKDVASLVDGKVPLVQLPDGIMSSLKLVGMWGGDTVPSSSPEAGQAWVLSTDTTIEGTNYNAGDWIYYFNSSWNRADITTSVKSVNGVSGENITLTPANIGAISDGYIDYVIGSTIPANKIVVTDKNGHIAGATVDTLTNEFSLKSTSGDVTFDSTSKNTNTNGSEDLDVTMKITNAGYTNIADKLRRDLYVNGVAQPFRKKLQFTGDIVPTSGTDNITLDFSRMGNSVIYFDGSNPASEEFLDALMVRYENKDDIPFYIAFRNNNAIHFIGINKNTNASGTTLVVQSDENTTTVNGTNVQNITSKGTLTFDASGNITAFAISSTTAKNSYLPLSGGTMTGHVYLNGIKEHSYNSTTKLIFGNSTTQYATIRANQNGSIVFADSLTDNTNGVGYTPNEKSFRPTTDNVMSLGTSNYKWTNVYANTFYGAFSGNATSATKLATSRNFYVSDNDGTNTGPATAFTGEANATIKLPATIKATLSGNASSSTYATNARITETEPTTGTWYYPTWVSGVAANTNYPLRGNDGFRYYTLEGTASANGRALLQVGNATASGTAGNKYGEIRIYNTSSGYTSLVGTASSTNRTITFPNATGTVALTSNLSSYLPLAGGTMTGSIKSTFASSTWINGVTNAVVSGNYTGYGAVVNAPVKDGRISISTYPSSDNLVYFGYASASQISNGTNSLNKQMTWDAVNNKLSATTFAGALSGNASTATKLQTARTLTIGSKGKTFDGSANVSWTLAEIGAAAASHTHSGYASSSHTHNYLPLGGGTLTGAVSSNSAISTSSTLASQSHRIFIQASAPSSPSTNDIWIDI